MKPPDLLGEVVTDDITLPSVTLPDPPLEQTGFQPHDGENRRTRREAVAKFVGPKDEGKGLRRRLLKQRQRDARGKLDVKTRRLQRKALR